MTAASATITIALNTALVGAALLPSPLQQWNFRWDSMMNGKVQITCCGGDDERLGSSYRCGVRSSIVPVFFSNIVVAAASKMATTPVVVLS